MSVLEALEIPSGPAVLGLLPRLAATVGGRAPAFVPVPANDPREAARLCDSFDVGGRIAEEIAVVVATSGTTGKPKGAQLSSAALQASAEATHERLGGPGTWLLALPAHHVAGLQVLLRSVAAGTQPAVVDVSGGFDPGALVAAIAAMPGPRRYTSLVPTQLVKALTDPEAALPLADLDAVLVGGAALAPATAARARDLGIPVVRTYGMSETCGGCVYDGVPLTGVLVDIHDARVRLGGTTLASGYRGMPEHPAFSDPGWFRTDDSGFVRQGKLTVTGRIDDAISTGGLLVAPQVVEHALSAHPAVQECAVLGVPEPRLGHAVVAVVVPAADYSGADGLPALATELREAVGAELDGYAVPRQLRFTAQLPMRGPGKLDRRALTSLWDELADP